MVEPSPEMSLMPLTLDQIEIEALKLPIEERADLAQRLFASLEGEETPEDLAEVEQAWLTEAEHRYQRYLMGDTQPVPAADAIARVRSQLRDR
jgi:putative addiction module component (TIGR02574 family)